jgi:hypothetical protein
MQKIKYTGIKEDNAAFRIVNAKLLTEELARLPKGRYSLTVEKARKAKSNPQLGYYYACVLPLSHKLLLEAGWDFSSEDEVDIFWKDLYANKEIVNRNSGEIMTIPALKRDMSTTEFMTFVDAVKNHCAEYLNGYVPEPEQNLTIEYK